MPRRAQPDSLPLPEEPQRPTDEFERRARKRGAVWVAGVDEAGRGPLAGPVVVAAVMFDGAKFPRGLQDSKQIDRAERERLYEKIMTRAMVSVAIASRERIDRMNILRASLWGMSKALKGLERTPDHVLIDGNMLPPWLPCPAQALIGGDGRSVSVAAASIVAKVTRDRLMARVGRAFPGYGFESHMGYSTPAHFAALDERGPCIHHRRSFSPVRLQLEPECEPEALLI